MPESDKICRRSLVGGLLPVPGAGVLRNAAAPRGDGRSEDSTNAIQFVNCRWESFRDGAPWLRQGYGRAVLREVFLVKRKMETAYVRGPFLSLHPGVQNLRVENPCGGGRAVRSDRLRGAGAGLAAQRVGVAGRRPRARLRARARHPSLRPGQQVWVDGPGRQRVGVIALAASDKGVPGRAGYLHDAGGRVLAD